MEEQEKYKAICTDCGAECEVPFEPTPGKPVRCQDCFRKNRPRRSFGNQRFDNRRFDNRRFDRPGKKYKAICVDCKKECEVPFEPTPGKPVRCQDCFRKFKNSEESDEQF